MTCVLLCFSSMMKGKDGSRFCLKKEVENLEEISSHSDDSENKKEIPLAD